MDWFEKTGDMKNETMSIVEYLKAIFLSWTGLTKMGFAALMAAFLEIVMPIKPFLAAALVLVVADFILGILASKKEGHKITSSKMRRTGNKVTAYLMLIWLCQVVSSTFFQGATYMAYTVACYICLVELWSVGENVGRLTGTDVSSVLGGIFEKVFPFKVKGETRK